MNICVLGKAALPSRRKTVIEKYPAVLDCLIDTNLPSDNVIYSWTKNGADATSDARATIIASGALFIKSTRRTDSGVYKCTAKTFDSNGLVNYPGADIMLDVQCKLMEITKNLLLRVVFTNSSHGYINLQVVLYYQTEIPLGL